MSAGDTYENKYLDAAFGDNRATALFPATVYAALFTAAPTDAGGGTEVAGGAYARVAVANTSANWPNAAGGQKKNANTIQFPTATAAWGMATHWALMDALTAGAIIHWNALTSGLNVVAGMTPLFTANQLVIGAD
jgi:hypothetical protein